MNFQRDLHGHNIIIVMVTSIILLILRLLEKSGWNGVGKERNMGIKVREPCDPMFRLWDKNLNGIKPYERHAGILLVFNYMV